MARSNRANAETRRLRRLFSLYTDDYFQSMAEIGYEDLEEGQEGSFASLAYGAAGIAWVHWFAGCVERKPVLVRRTHRWLEAAFAGEHEVEAFLERGAASASAMPEGAFLLGRAGLHFTHALVAHTLGERDAAAKAISRFAALSRATGWEGDIFRGATGCLLGATTLFRRIGGLELRALGRELAVGLIRRSREAPLGNRASSGADERIRHWPDLPELGLGHGSLGVVLALLQWSAVSGDPVPDWVAGTLSAILAAVLREPSLLCPSPVYHHRLCGGFAGVAIVSVRAFELLGDPALLDAARTAVTLALGRTVLQPDLCCGRAGVACAALALARVDPGGPWWREATELALSLLLCEPEDWAVAGLYGGEAGFVWLALTLRHELGGGPPCIDALLDPGSRRLPLSPLVWGSAVGG